MKSLIAAARGEIPVDLLISNARVYNPFIREWEETSFSVFQGRVAGLGESRAEKVIDLAGACVSPGFIDAHVHIESSLLPPGEYGRLVSTHGTTTVIADPHEIANVCGREGIRFMFACRSQSLVDIRYTLPSCVPATPLDESVEPLYAADLREFLCSDGVAGLGEMMNVPGVLSQDPLVMEKLALTPIRDGHAPMLTGPDLQAYIAAGIQSDHETLTREEGEEKLRSGMYLYIREGSTEKNLHDLAPLVQGATAGRCAFCTDDRHVDMLATEGHIDDCIRNAIHAGMNPELAYLCATLSPAERFGLTDRGALTPGRRADFCVLSSVEDCRVARTFIRGVEIGSPGYHPPLPCPYPFRTRVPERREIGITGEGRARVIGIIPGQIATRSLVREVAAEEIPDPGSDILKVVVASRYHDDRVGCGLVSGLQMTDGAIAASIAHDSHHIIAAGTSDTDILTACREVIRNRGGMVCVHDGRTETLPLPCAGLMSDAPWETVHEDLRRLNRLAERTGAIDNPFMYLSFLPLTVIPALRITPSGVFDCHSFAHVPLFLRETV